MRVKQKILNQISGNINYTLLRANVRDNATEPYLYLQQEFKNLGYDFCGVDAQHLDEAACVIFWDCASYGGLSLLGRTIRYLKQVVRREPTRNLISEIRGKNDLLKVLILFEPPSVDPDNAKVVEVSDPF